MTTASGYHEPQQIDLLTVSGLHPMNETEAARWFERQGSGVAEHADRLWVRPPRHLGGAPGYWLLPDPLAALSCADIGWPTRQALGYRAVVTDETVATGHTLQEVIGDLPTFGAHRLSPDRRRRVRRALRLSDFRVLDSPGPLLTQGYALYCSVMARTGMRGKPSRSEYREMIARRYSNDPQLVIGAFQSGRLVGYSSSHAISPHMHFTDLCVSGEALRDSVSDALYWLTLAAWATVPDVRTCSLGMFLAERDGLAPYKSTFGSKLVRLPVISHLRPPVAAYLRLRRPHSYRRLTGWPVAVSGAQVPPSVLDL